MNYETFLLRLNDGPVAGTRVLRSDAGVLWPLPSELPVRGGRYVKVSESQLESPSPGVLRGAEYRWAPDEETA